VLAAHDTFWSDREIDLDIGGEEEAARGCTTLGLPAFPGEGSPTEQTLIAHAISK
jgi:hypothetical protein